MKVLTIKPPQVKTEPEDRPEKCPHCGSIYLHRHGYSTKPVKDHQVRQVVTVRYKCARCSRTFRHYPSGVTRADQSQRLIVLAAVAWALGLSTRSAGFARAAEGGWLFDKFGAGIGKSTALRDVRTVSEQRQSRRLKSVRSGSLGWMEPWSKSGARSTGFDCPGPGNRPTIPDITCFASYVRNTRIPEHDVKALLNWLEPLVKACGVEVIVTDAAFPRTTWLLRLSTCGRHCREPPSPRLRRVGRLIKAFEAELGEQVKPILDEVRRIIDELPQDGGKRRSAARLG
jgi:hypothetical protein